MRHIVTQLCHWCLDYFNTDIGHQVVLTMYIVDAVFFLDILVSLRKGIITIHGIVTALLLSEYFSRLLLCSDVFE